MFVGILLMLIVDHTYCLIGQAALPMSQKPLWSIVSYVALSVCGFVRFSWGLEYYMILSWTGNSSKPVPYLLIGITALYLALAHTIQLIRDRRVRKE